MSKAYKKIRINPGKSPLRKIKRIKINIAKVPSKIKKMTAKEIEEYVQSL